MASIERTRPRSPGEKTSPWPSANIINISTDHGPRPHMLISFSVASVSGIFFNESRLSSPRLTATAIALSVLLFAPERPAGAGAAGGEFQVLFRGELPSPPF